jgi:hypothetical protein
MTGQARSLAANLLEDVAHNIMADGAAGAAAAAEGLPAIDIVVGSAAASTAAAVPVPEACEITAATPVAPAVSDQATALPNPPVSLLWCDLACLPAGRQQQLTLHLQLPATGGAAAAATACRLLCFNSGGVLLDEDAELQQTLR